MLADQESDYSIMDYSKHITIDEDLAYDIQEIPIELKISSSRTIRSNKTAANNFREYLREKGLDDQFQKFDNETLNKTLGQFYLDARQADGTHYKVNSLENFRYGINRYLKSSPYFRKLDIIKDEDFSDANHFFKMAISELKRLGKGDVDHHPVITDVDLKTLYSSVHLDPNTPAGLLNKVQFDIRMYFFRRGMENMSKMTKSTFKVMQDLETGLKIVVKVDETGNQKENDYENSTGIMPECPGSYMCPVKSFQLYLSKVHPDCDRLWQRPREHFYYNDDVWFCRSAVGEKNLAKFMSSLSKMCTLSQSYTNHSIRATGASILRNYFEPAQIMAVMGQKSALYLSGYQRISNKEKISMGQAITASLGNGPSPLTFTSSLKSMCHDVEMDTGTILLENQERNSNLVPDSKAMAHSQSLMDINFLKETSKFPIRTEPITSMFNWTRPVTLKSSSLKASNNETNIPCDNHATKREASATVTSAELQNYQQHPSKILRRYLEDKSCKALNDNSNSNSSSSDNVSIVEVNQSPPKELKKTSTSKGTLPQTKVTFQPTNPIPTDQHQRKMLIVSEHQRNVMTCLASLWKKGQLCDAGIGNGTTIVMVHKIVLLAVCPKLLSMFNKSGESNRFLQVNFPETISHEGLTSFAEYLYNGVLDLRVHLLSQLRQMALQLSMKELEILCSSHLSQHDLQSMTVKVNPSQMPSSPFDSIQIVNFKTSPDDFQQTNNSGQFIPSTKHTLSSNIYHRFVISSPELMMNNDEYKRRSMCFLPTSVDEEILDVENPNNKFEELINLPDAHLQDPYIASLGFAIPCEKTISISNIKSEPINIDDDDDDDNSCNQTTNYPHNAPTASPADVLTTNYSSPVNQLAQSPVKVSTSRSSNRRKSRSTVTRIKYSIEDAVPDTGWQEDLDFDVKKEKGLDDPLLSSSPPQSDCLEADTEPFPIEMISVVKKRKLSLKSAPD